MEHDDHNEALIRSIRAACHPMQPIPLTTNPDVCYPVRAQASAIRAVLFDVYGTLLISASGDIDTAGGSATQSALTEVLERFKIRRTPEEVQRAFRNEVTRIHAALREKHPWPEVRVEEIWAEVLGLTGETLDRFGVAWEAAANPVWPMPGLQPFLQTLAHLSIPLGIVSNAQFYTPLFLQALLGRALSDVGFRADLCIYSYEFRMAKPSPELFTGALGRLAAEGITPGEVIYIGNDMRNDIAPAAKLGMQTILYAGDGGSLRLREGDPSIEGVAPDWIVRSLEEAGTIIKQGVFL